MSTSTVLILSTVAAYLLGSIPFGVLLARRRGVDVRHAGSGNIGATNVARTVGKKIAAVVLLLDAGKGAVPISLWLYAQWPPLDHAWAPFALGLAPILGHCFSPWLRFAGGKGVATSLGVVLAITPALAGVAVAVFAAVYARFRVASVASLSGAGIIPALYWFFGPGPIYFWLMLAAVMVIVIQHRANIRRLLRREELRV